ncbi:hypothetical protein KL86DPRO_10196 [uncultured delta proteobacterium]|uniref:Uncharacterized protein n=1 Tax=uncultured delta proteobacterium TaxID=34034 RepID=A0A212IW88_9DELT|nr:hypothetical protein KL86DPRO_10196 [uncultured delta proteobacterium]
MQYITRGGPGELTLLLPPAID